MGSDLFTVSHNTTAGRLIMKLSTINSRAERIKDLFTQGQGINSPRILWKLQNKFATKSCWESLNAGLLTPLA